MADSMHRNKPDDQLLEPIKPRRASDQIFEQLRDLILRGRLKPGERLMGERDMAARFEVSRPDGPGGDSPPGRPGPDRAPSGRGGPSSFRRAGSTRRPY